ncbi:unnamed protein product, partial [marine sediment metagenome]
LKQMSFFSQKKRSASLKKWTRKFPLPGKLEKKEKEL